MADLHVAIVTAIGMLEMGDVQPALFILRAAMVDKSPNPQDQPVDKLAKLQDRDGIRYRWLRNNMTYTDRGPFTIGTLMAPKVRRWYHDSPITGIDTLDAAIDQAMLIQRDDH